MCISMLYVARVGLDSKNFLATCSWKKLGGHKLDYPVWLRFLYPTLLCWCLQGVYEACVDLPRSPLKCCLGVKIS